MKCAPSEHPFIEGCDSTKAVWLTLQQHHVHQGPMSQVTLIQEALSARYSSSTPFAETTLILCNLNRRIWDMGAPNPEGFLCILMLLALSADESLSAIRDAIVSGLSTATKDHAYTSANIVAHLDYKQQAHSMRTVPVPAEAHAGQCSFSDLKQTICSNCKKPRHTSEFCIQPGGRMAGKTIVEAQQACDAKHGKKNKDKQKEKSPTGSIIQSGNQDFIVDSNGKAHEIIGSSSITAPPSTADTTHFLQMDDLDSIDPLVLESMCAADVDEYTYTAECAWLATQDSLHASVGWHERRRNIEELDLAAIMAVPLPSSSKRSDVSLESSPFLLDSTCTTHISPEQSNFATLHPISDRTVTGVGVHLSKLLVLVQLNLSLPKDRLSYSRTSFSSQHQWSD